MMQYAEYVKFPHRFVSRLMWNAFMCGIKKKVRNRMTQVNDLRIHWNEVQE